MFNLETQNYSKKVSKLECFCILLFEFVKKEEKDD
jgi:hypothetical protein